MEKFLETTARYILDNHPDGLENTCLIFPNRRSSVFFTAYLQKLLTKTVIGPKIITINEFITGFSDKQRAEKLKLIAILFEVFKKHSRTTEEFDDFYFWGEVLLSDFDDIDKYMVDAESIFTNVSDLKEIEAQFQFLEEEQKEVLLRFWGSLGKWEDFKNQEEFMRLWKILNPIYNDFREKLEKGQIAYDGMIYREVAEKAQSENGLPLKETAYYVIGLNALNQCEVKILKHLKNTGKGIFLWDFDTSYLNDIKNEAGFFLRENVISFPPPDDFTPETEGLNNDKYIRFISVASSHGQAQAIPRELKNVGKEFDNTAIILADESLLFPVLGAIPETVSSINITMGYPVKNSSVFGFITLLSGLIKNIRKDENQHPNYYYRFVFDILNHQLLGGIEPEKIREFQDDAKKHNRIYIYPEDLNFSPLHSAIFNIPDKITDYGKYFRTILKQLWKHLQKQQPDNKIIPELIVTIFQGIEKLEATIADVKTPDGQTINAVVFFRLMNQYLGQLSVSYEGEPLKGLQVMGILETRCLDFENVIILGFNEDFWPRPSTAPSFIPQNLRFAFGLPSIDNQDAMYAYYFYRLIQRSQNITATYNTVKEGFNTGELSRFGNQLIYDSKHKIQQENLEFRFQSNPLHALEAKSSGEIVKALIDKYTKERPLSPSALNTFIDCRYRFYLRYIAGLPEGDEIAEEVDSRLFGNIFHKAVEYLYKQAEKPVTAKWIDKILKEKIPIENAVRKAFASEYYKTDKPETMKFEGSIRLSFEFIRSYIIQLLKVDKKETPFEIISLEGKYVWKEDVQINGDTKKIPVGGIIDRLDKVDGLIRVIDYKTGNVKSMSFKEISQLFDGSQKDHKKEVFQALLYGLIIRKKYFPNDSLRPGIYGLRELFNDKFFPYFKKGVKEISFDEEIGAFEENLKTLLNEIFSSETVFTQTEITDRCKTCPYKIICHRG